MNNQWISNKKKIIKKKYLLTLLLNIFVVSGINAQQTERITITELGPLGGALRTITVNAVRITSGQQNFSLEDNFEVIYESTLDPNTGKWSDWVQTSKSPARFLTLRQYYDALQTDFLAFPNGTRFLYMDGLQTFRLATIPRGKSSPIWWDEDGRSINYYFTWYVIVP